MALSDEHQEIQRLTQLAENTEKPAELRINAARKLLRDALKKDGTFSTRGVRLAKRIAKLFMTDESVSVEVRQKASSLYQFVIDQAERETGYENDCSNSAVEFAKKPEKSHAEQLAEKNVDWNVYKYNPYLKIEVPAEWLYYRSLEDLEQYGIPADPRFRLKGHLFDTFKILREDGQVFYVEKGLWWDQISNPAYIAALDGRHENWSSMAIDSIDENGKIVKNTDGNKY